MGLLLVIWVKEMRTRKGSKGKTTQELAPSMAAGRQAKGLINWKFKSCYNKPTMTDTVHPSDNTNSNQTLNKLRAAVLGANDGVVSISSILMGVAGANASHGAIVTAGLAALVAGALSMAVENTYLSVASQMQKKLYIDKEKRELRENPAAELEELTAGYEAKGLSRKTAHLVAKELTAIDPVKAHFGHAEFQLDEEDVVNPMHAAVASFISFTAGGLISVLGYAIGSNQ